MRYLINASDGEWEQHSVFKDVQIKVLHSKEVNGSQATVTLTGVPNGGEVPTHVHERSDNVLYILQGTAKIEIEGAGIYDLNPGSCIRIPAGTPHRIFDISKGFIIYDMWTPPIF